MAIAFGGRKKRLVLDIGTSAVRVCELSKTKSGYQLTRFVQREFDSDPSLDEETRRKLRVEALKDVLKRSKARLTKIMFSVPGQSVFTRSRTLPPVPEYKVTQIVKYEIQQQIPFGLDQIAMDYQVLSRNEQGGYEVMMAAIKVDVVDKQLEMLKSIKRPVAQVDVAPLAAYNWFKHAGEFGDQGECVALVYIGASTTDIVIERGGQFRFTRPLNVGGNEVTKALAGAFNMDFAAAEKVKRERGFAPTGDAQKDGKGGEVIGQALQRFTTEIVRSFAYFRSLPGGGPVGRVILAGGGARLRNLVPYLQRQLDMDVQIVQPLKGVTVASAAVGIKDCPEQACVALGMALRCCEPVPLEINLIPPRLVETARRKEQVVYWALIIMTLVVMFLSEVPAKHKANQLVKERIRELQQTIRAYDPELAQKLEANNVGATSTLNDQLTSRKAHLQKIEQQVNTLDMARRQRRFWLDELSLVNDARPAAGGIWFGSVETVVIEGGQNKPGAAPPPPTPGLGAGAGAGGATSIGFPGIAPKGGGGAALRSGLMRGGPAAGGQPSGGGVSSMPTPNGLIIHGYAESDQTITQYRDELRRVVRELPNGLFLSVGNIEFSETSVQKVSWDTLYNAPVGASAGAGRQDQGAGGYQSGPSLYTFTIKVKVLRTVERPAPKMNMNGTGDKPT